MAENNMADKSEMLNQINMAITNILVGGQSYKIGSRTLTRADLGTLMDLRNEMEAELSNETPWLFGDTYVSFFFGPR